MLRRRRKKIVVTGRRTCGTDCGTNTAFTRLTRMSSMDRRGRRMKITAGLFALREKISGMDDGLRWRETFDFNRRMIGLRSSKDVITFENGQFHSNLQISIGRIGVRLLISVEKTRFGFISTSGDTGQIQINKSDLLERSTGSTFLKKTAKFLLSSFVFREPFEWRSDRNNARE